MGKKSKKSWIMPLVAAHLWVWGWFMVTAALSDISIENMVLGGAIVYGISMSWVLRSFVVSRPDVRPVHWIDLFIGRLSWAILYLIIVAAMAGIMVYTGKRILDYSWDIWRVYVGSISFMVCCVLTLLMGWFFWGYLIKQSLITEANIKAHEAFTGTKRTVVY